MAMFTKENISAAFKAAFPIMLGYVTIGLPCGVLEQSIGFNAVQVLMLSVLFYSGAGQFMIPNMWIAGSPMASIIASVSLVNSRQMLYSAAFVPACRNANKLLTFIFGASVTDESYGVNIVKFQEDPSWSVGRATLVNFFSNSSWTISNIIGVLIGDAVNIPLAVAAFAMTSIFICLLLDQKPTAENLVAIGGACLGVITCKLVGLSGPAILIGAIIGVVAALIFSIVRGKNATPEAEAPEAAGLETAEEVA